MRDVVCGLPRGGGQGCIGTGQAFEQDDVRPGFTVQPSEHLAGRKLLEEADELVAGVEADLVGRKVGARLSADTMTMLDAIRERLAAAHGAHGDVADHLQAALQGLQDLCGEPEPGTDDAPEADEPAPTDKAAPDGYTVHCSVCGSTEHVSADCPEPEPAPRKKSIFDFLIPSRVRRV